MWHLCLYIRLLLMRHISGVIPFILEHERQAKWVWNIRVFIHFSLTAGRSLKLWWLLAPVISLYEFWLWLLVPIDVSVPISAHQLALPLWPASLFSLKAKHLCKICGYLYIIFNINAILATQISHFFFFFKKYSQNIFHSLSCLQKMLSILYYEILGLFTAVFTNYFLYTFAILKS